MQGPSASGKAHTDVVVHKVDLGERERVINGQEDGWLYDYVHQVQSGVPAEVSARAQTCVAFLHLNCLTGLDIFRNGRSP